MARIAVIEVTDGDADLFRKDELTRLLRRALSERGLPADFVSLMPPGTPSMATAALLVPLFEPRPATALAEAVRAWLAGRPGTLVTVTIDGDTIELADPVRKHEFTTWLLRRSGFDELS
ncbi:effector-associated constant component EACC1 [Actinocorallia longicatena]|uniref:Uncharacterized protein n=1 Tax=Actinocorallia longicatena TaxID=111803 RepID=A0ABP6Q796_9ACTN